MEHKYLEMSDDEFAALNRVNAEVAGIIIIRRDGQLYTQKVKAELQRET